MSRFFEELPKLVFKTSAFIAVVGGSFLYGVYAHNAYLPPVPQLHEGYRALQAILNPEAVVDPKFQHLQPTRNQGDGVVVNQAANDGALIGLAGFFDGENQIRLIERDGTVVRKWPLDYFEHFPQARACDVPTPLQVDTHGMHITPQGEVLFNYEYCGTVQLNQCGAVDWTIVENTHHSLTPAAAGGYWILGRDEWWSEEAPERFLPFTGGPPRWIFDDTIMRVSTAGEVLEEYSAAAMMKENGLHALVSATGQIFDRLERHRGELVHTNKLQELSADLADAYPLFEPGDLALSIRGLNLVLVFDPDSRVVKWHQTGPWLRQHDPEFRPDGRLSILNNNAFETSYVGRQTDLSTPFTTNIMAIDPVTRETEVVFGDAPGEEMLSVIRGQHEILDNNGILITEFDAGRVLEVNGDREIVWEYVNRYDDDFVGEVTNAALYPAGYFETDWGSCE